MIPYENIIKHNLILTKKYLKEANKIKRKGKNNPLSLDDLSYMKNIYELVPCLKSSCEDAFKIDYSKKKNQKIRMKLLKINFLVNTIEGQLEIFEFEKIDVDNFENDFPEYFLC
jgi:hypothetical protein